MALSVEMRHRLGLTVSGASPVRNAYESLSHTTRPSSAVTTQGSSAAMNPRRASSKSCSSWNGRVCVSRAFSAAIAGVAGRGVWGVMRFSLAGDRSVRPG